MTNYKVSLSSSNYNIKLSLQTKYKVTGTTGGLLMPASFEDLANFDGTNKSDGYVMMYDATTQKYRMVNPDDVLSAAVTEPISPGLPNDFVNTLDVDLDNKIDLDAGSF